MRESVEMVSLERPLNCELVITRRQQAIFFDFRNAMITHAGLYRFVSKLVKASDFNKLCGDQCVIPAVNVVILKFVFLDLLKLFNRGLPPWAQTTASPHPAE